jgi:hypothetical protein
MINVQSQTIVLCVKKYVESMLLLIEVSRDTCGEFGEIIF